jgi:hypothetical protein
MKLVRLFFVLGMLTLVALMSAGPSAQAGNPPPGSPIIVGPEYWGVVVINCNSGTVTLRAKRVVDCDVETQALIEDEGVGICGTGLIGSNLFHQWIHGVLFEETGVPIVTKVKNFKEDIYTIPPADYAGKVYSADVEIRFCTNCAP